MAVEKFDNKNGSHDVTIYGDHQTVESQRSDRFVIAGQQESFVFSDSYGHDVVRGFNVSGPLHDSASFDTQYNSIAVVLNHAYDSSGGVVLTLGGGDTVRFEGLTKHDLNTHRQDFSIHAPTI